MRFPKIREPLHRFLTKRFTRDRVSTTMEAAGAVSIAYGAGLIYVPAGWIVGGLLAIGMAFLLDGGER